MIPSVTIHRRLNKSRIDIRWLSRTVNAAVPLVLNHLKGDAPPLSTLAEIEAVIMSDHHVAKVHKQFMNNPKPTDVITFHHGEIIVSAGMAKRIGAEHGNDLETELCLYLIHGLMHLAGWDDHEADEAAEMKRIQEGILKAVSKLHVKH